MIGRWSELPRGSASLQDVFADQLLPQREMSRVLSLPVIRLVRVVEPSYVNHCRGSSQEFCRHVVSRLKRAPHLRVTIEIAKNE